MQIRGTPLFDKNVRKTEFIQKDKEFARDLQLLSAGIVNDWELRAKYMNEDEETAKAALPKMQDVVTETQNVVE